MIPGIIGALSQKKERLFWARLVEAGFLTPVELESGTAATIAVSALYNPGQLI